MEGEGREGKPLSRGEALGGRGEGKPAEQGRDAGCRGRCVWGQFIECLRSQSNMESLNSVLRIESKGFKQNDVV